MDAPVYKSLNFNGWQNGSGKLIQKDRINYLFKAEKNG